MNSPYSSLTAVPPEVPDDKKQKVVASPDSTTILSGEKQSNSMNRNNSSYSRTKIK